MAWAAVTEAAAARLGAEMGWEASRKSLGSLNLFPHSPAPGFISQKRVSQNAYMSLNKSILKGKRWTFRGHNVPYGGTTCWRVSSIPGPTHLVPAAPPVMKTTDVPRHLPGPSGAGPPGRTADEHS